MPQTGEGAWVRFRVHIVGAPGFAAGGFGTPQGAAKLLVKVTGISPEVGGPDDLAARAGVDDGGRLIVDSFVVRVEVGDPFSGDFNRDVLPSLRMRFQTPVKALAGLLWVRVLLELPISELASSPGEPPRRDTGRLFRSLRIVLDSDGLGAAVGSNLEYASYLEFGTRDMAARPFLVPALEGIRSLIQNEVWRIARDALENRPPSEFGSRFIRWGLQDFEFARDRTGLPEDMVRKIIPLREPSPLLESLKELFKVSGSDPAGSIGVR